MAQHFLLSAAARTLSLARVLTMSEDEALMVFRRIRWPDTDGEPVCPVCACRVCWQIEGGKRFLCRDCRKRFSATSGTLFHSRKLPFRKYLAAVVLFVNSVKGAPALQLGRELDVQFKTAFVLAHKLREAMGAEMKGAAMGGDGRNVEVDGAWFGGYQRPANRKTDRIDRRRKENQTGKRRCVVVIREREGRTVSKVFLSEEESVAFLKQRIRGGSTVHADEASAWNVLHARYATRRINHGEAYSAEDACTNQAESYFARLRRAEIGQHHAISRKYLGRYAQEMAWREDHRRDPNGAQFHRVLALVAANQPSVDFRGYWQRHLDARKGA